MQNKKTLYILLGVILLGILGGGAFFIASQNAQKQEEVTVEDEDTTIPTLAPEDIGLEVQVSDDGRYVTIVVNKASDIKHLEWEVSYDADIPASERIGGDFEDKVTQSFGGEAELTGSATFKSKPKELGTCSSGKCRFDTGIENIVVVLKVTKDDGKVYSVEYKQAEI